MEKDKKGRQEKVKGGKTFFFHREEGEETRRNAKDGKTKTGWPVKHTKYEKFSLYERECSGFILLPPASLLRPFLFNFKDLYSQMLLPFFAFFAVKELSYRFLPFPFFPEDFIRYCSLPFRLSLFSLTMK